MKPKREITLGEMQDECNKHTTRYAEGGSVTRCEECEPNIKTVCRSMKYDFDVDTKPPFRWDLTDPPRFTEAQMALLKALWDNGAGYAFQAGQGITLLSKDGTKTVMSLTIFASNELRDRVATGVSLAELFGKEGADAK